MGIDFSHCDASWAYSGFMAFRKRLAQEIGIDLMKMEGFTDDDKALKWSKVQDPIKHILDHSDCEGTLSPTKCALVAPRLLELISGWPKNDYDREMATELAKGMKLAAKEGKRLLFQ